FLAVRAKVDVAILVPVLAASMGIRTAVVRALGVPDLTTTVLTQTVAGIAADSSLAGGSNPRFGRRLGSITLMLAGAAAGALFHVRAPVYGLLSAAFLEGGAALLLDRSLSRVATHPDGLVLGQRVPRA